MSDAHQVRDFRRWLPNCGEYCTFPVCLEAWRKAQIACWHPAELESGYFSVEDTARLMQGFVPERNQGPPRHRHAHRLVLVVCVGAPDQCYREITGLIEYTGGSATCWSWRRSGLSAAPTQT